MSAYSKTVEDLADDLIEISDTFVGSFEGAFKAQDDLTDFLKSRERYWIGIGTGGNAPPGPRDYDVPDDLWKDTVSAKFEDDGQIIRNASLHGMDPSDGLKMPKMPNFGKMGSKLMAGGAMASNFISRLGKGKRGDQAELDKAEAFIKKNPNFGRERHPRDQAELDRAKAGAAAITKPTKALIGEKGPEIVVPMQKLGDAINSIYKQGSKTMMEATSGFMKALPSAPGRSKVMGEINKIKNKFGLGTLKTKGGGKIGLPNPIEWWNKGRDERVEDEDNASWKELIDDDLKQRGQSDEGFATGEKPPMLGRIDHAFNPFRPAEKGGPGSGPTPAVRQAFERPVKGMMNLGKGIAGSVGAQVNKFKSNMVQPKRSIPTPFDNGRDMFGQRIHLNPPTESAWKKTMAAAAADGVDLPSSVTSAFRDSQDQQQLIENEDDPNVITPAPQGMSPHQQGWGVDIDQGSKANHWMREHGHKFGFHWEGPADPVHFDFINNEPREKYMLPENSDWKPTEKEKGDKATTTGGKLVSVIGDFLKKKMGAKGDPKDSDIQKLTSTTTNIESPDMTPAQQQVIDQPVEQAQKEKPLIAPMPMVLPGAPMPIPMPSKVEKLDPEVMRSVVIDQFGKGTRIEVAYV